MSSRSEYAPCPLCGKQRTTHVFAASDFDSGQSRFDLVRCHHCGAVRTEPMVNDEALEAYYDAAYYGHGPEKFNPIVESLLTRTTRHRATRLLSLIGSHEPARVLDIGCGRGVVLKALLDLGCECHGVERAGFQVTAIPNGIEIHNTPIEALSFEGDSFDLIVVWHVLEHLRHPVDAIRLASQWLKPGGVLAIATPNFDGLQARLFGRHWFHLDLPRHLYHFGPATLRNIVTAQNLEVVGSGTLSPEQSLFGFIQSTFNAAFPGITPNRFYGQLKSAKAHRLSADFWLSCAQAILLFPLALLEMLVSAAMGRGACVHIYARKPPATAP